MNPVRLDAYHALRNALERALATLRRRPKAQVVDLSDYFTARRLRRIHERLGRALAERDRSDPEPPEAA